MTLRALVTIQKTGGKGRWSDALEHFAAEFETPHPVVVNRDWGFDIRLLP